MSDQETGLIASNWLWGSVWIFYAYFYGFYFAHVGRRLKPEPGLAHQHGSLERLRLRRIWCYRFAAFMMIPTILEAVRSTAFTSLIISVMPCVFGVWVMHAVWVDVLRAKLPKAEELQKR